MHADLPRNRVCRWGQFTRERFFIWASPMWDLTTFCLWFTYFEWLQVWKVEADKPYEFVLAELMLLVYMPELLLMMPKNSISLAPIQTKLTSLSPICSTWSILFQFSALWFGWILWYPFKDSGSERPRHNSQFACMLALLHDQNYDHDLFYACHSASLIVYMGCISP